MYDFESKYFQDRPNDPKTKRDIYRFLAEPENIANMIFVSKLGLPALTAVVKELEEKFSDKTDFPISDYRNRQTIGRIIKNILWHFGFEPYSGNLAAATHLRDFAQSKFFTTSAIYKKVHKPTHSLTIQICEK